MVDRMQDMQATHRAHQSAEEPFRQELDPIRARCDTLATMINELEVLQSDYLANNKPAKKKKIDKKSEDIARLTEDTKGLIEAMDRRSDDALSRGHINKAQATVRRQAAHRMSEKLLAATRRAWEMQSAHDKDCQNQVARRIRVRYTDARTGEETLTEEESQHMAQKLVRANRQDHIFLQARAELEDAMRQHAEILDLQREVQDLYRVVKDLHTLTQAQTQQLGAVQDAAQSAHRSLEKGVGELRKARKAQ